MVENTNGLSTHWLQVHLQFTCVFAHRAEYIPLTNMRCNECVRCSKNIRIYRANSTIARITRCRFVSCDKVTISLRFDRIRSCTKLVGASFPSRAVDFRVLCRGAFRVVIRRTNVVRDWLVPLLQPLSLRQRAHMLCSWLRNSYVILAYAHASHVAGMTVTIAFRIGLVAKGTFKHAFALQ